MASLSLPERRCLPRRCAVAGGQGWDRCQRRRCGRRPPLVVVAGWQAFGGRTLAALRGYPERMKGRSYSTHPSSYADVQCARNAATRLHAVAVEARAEDSRVETTRAKGSIPWRQYTLNPKPQRPTYLGGSTPLTLNPRGLPRRQYTLNPKPQRPAYLGGDAGQHLSGECVVLRDGLDHLPGREKEVIEGARQGEGDDRSNLG